MIDDGIPGRGIKFHFGRGKPGDLRTVRAMEKVIGFFTAVGIASLVGNSFFGRFAVFRRSLLSLPFRILFRILLRVLFRILFRCGISFRILSFLACIRRLSFRIIRYGFGRRCFSVI